jgi:hypothetical protein
VLSLSLDNKGLPYISTMEAWKVRGQRAARPCAPCEARHSSL